MKRKSMIKCMMLACILPFCSFTNDDDSTKKETQNIVLTNREGKDSNDENFQIPVIATLSNNVLNVQFTGTVPMATISLSNAVTGATVAQQSMAAMSGSFCTMPVSSGTYVLNVTDEQSGKSVSGMVDVEE